MTTTVLQAIKDASWIHITGTSKGELPTAVIRLSPSLLVEIDPTRTEPVEIQTMDYNRDRLLLMKLIGRNGVEVLDDHTESMTPASLLFTPTADWMTIHEFASAEWAMHWNPLPLDPALLALDLVCAQQQVAHLTGEHPDKNMAATAYPAALTLERLLVAGAINDNIIEKVRQAIRAIHDSLPLDYADTTPYSLPLPMTEEQIRQVLEPQPPNPDALITGSPDWRLTGNGPATSAEDSITVIPHIRNSRAITINVPAKRHARPENTPNYHAFITEIHTGHTIATATLSYTPASGTYTGHTIPQRPIQPTDQVDIRHYNNPNPPASKREERQAARTRRDAVRKYAQKLWRLVPGEFFHSSVAVAAASDNLLRINTDPQISVKSFVQFLSQDEYVRAAKSSHEEMTGSAEFGRVAATWRIHPSGASVHVALDAPLSAYPKLSLVRIHITSAAETTTYFMVFYSYDDEFVVSELTAPLPAENYSIAMDASPLRAEDLGREAVIDIAPSVSGCGSEGLRAWAEIARLLPEDSPLADALRPLLRGTE